jgi:predicted ABC-type transport system involved in lysophospholipase L1 biosynthesis ATPase subunit
MNSDAQPTDARSQPAELLLEAREVHKTYVIGRSSLEVLRGVNLKVERGEFLALQGASGAGKSTLLHLLGGLDHASRGELYLAGQKLASLPGAELARLRNRKVGFIFQAYHLFPELDALENVCLPARLARTPAAAAHAHATELLGRVGLGQRLEHRPSELSGGEQQRVAIARALINSPDLILADEPTGNLDTQAGAEIIELLCTLIVERKTTLIVATHDSDVAVRAPRVVRLVDGVLAGERRTSPA